MRLQASRVSPGLGEGVRGGVSSGMVSNTLPALWPHQIDRCQSGVNSLAGRLKAAPGRMATPVSCNNASYISMLLWIFRACSFSAKGETVNKQVGMPVRHMYPDTPSCRMRTVSVASAFRILHPPEVSFYIDTTFKGPYGSILDRADTGIGLTGCSGRSPGPGIIGVERKVPVVASHLPAPFTQSAGNDGAFGIVSVVHTQPSPSKWVRCRRSHH